VAAPPELDGFRFRQPKLGSGLTQAQRRNHAGARRCGSHCKRRKSRRDREGIEIQLTHGSSSALVLWTRALARSPQSPVLSRPFLRGIALNEPTAPPIQRVVENCSVIAGSKIR
jgi:hypothetical protein